MRQEEHVFRLLARVNCQQALPLLQMNSTHQQFYFSLGSFECLFLVINTEVIVLLKAFSKSFCIVKYYL